MQLTSCFTDDLILIEEDNNETTNALLASDSEDSVAIPELTHHNCSGTSAEIQSTHSLILIDDDSW